MSKISNSSIELSSSLPKQAVDKVTLMHGPEKLLRALLLEVL
jgi:hypothetical protein